MNINLEQIVLKRTAKIEQQNEELKIQSKNLKTANKNISLKNTEIENKNKSIIDSINYAKRIQNAMLPINKLFAEHFKEYFIFYKPRDIVSGDFYWFSKINQYRIIVVADCTGHGVPGAFVSMLGISLLNEVIRRKNITMTKTVLEQLRIQIKANLHQTDAEQITRDGMDIAITVINDDTKIIQFSGANNPLYIVIDNDEKKLKIHHENKIIFDNNRINGFKIRSLIDENSNKTLIELKPDRQPIGVYFNEHAFTQFNFKSTNSSTFYMLTDGFHDQFGGEHNTKYYARTLKELILKINSNTLNKQKEIIIETFNKWKNCVNCESKTYKQIDDILILGFRL